MLKLLSTLFLVIPLIISAQVDSLSLKYEAVIDSISLKQTILVLANDSLLGRETATLGQRKSEKYIVEQFKRNSIEPANIVSYIQNYDVVTNNLNTVSISFKDFVSRSPNDIYGTSFINDTNFTLSNIVFIGYGICSSNYDDYSNVSVKDKLVFMYEEEPVDESGKPILTKEEIKKWYNDDRANYAKKQGASGVVFISKDFIKTQNYFKRHYAYRDLSLYEKKVIFPSMYINEALFYYLFSTNSKYVDQFLYKKKGKKIRDKFDLIKKTSFTINSNREILQSSNVIGKLSSKNPNAPWIIVTAHYDHEGIKNDSIIYNGADDNASGTAALLTISKAFGKAVNDGVELENNILFMLVSGEEKGLLGSKYYVNHPIIPLENTLCNLNIDMIGRYDTKHPEDDNYVYIIGSDRISNDLHLINEKMNNLYTNLDFDYTYNAIDDPNRFYERSDHYNFAKKGIPVIFYYNGVHEDYHKPTDTEEKIVYSALLKRTKLVFHTAWYLAMMNKAKLN